MHTSHYQLSCVCYMKILFSRKHWYWFDILFWDNASVILFPIAITFYFTWWFIHFVDGFFSPIYAQLGINIFGMWTTPLLLVLKYQISWMVWCHVVVSSINDCLHPVSTLGFDPVVLLLYYMLFSVVVYYTVCIIRMLNLEIRCIIW